MGAAAELSCTIRKLAGNVALLGVALPPHNAMHLQRVWLTSSLSRFGLCRYRYEGGFFPLELPIRNAHDLQDAPFRPLSALLRIWATCWRLVLRSSLYVWMSSR